MQLRLAAGVCVLTAGLFVGSAGGAIAAADTESTGTTNQTQDVGAAPEGITTASSSIGPASQTSKYPIRDAIQDMLKKLRGLGQPTTKQPITKVSSSPVIIVDTTDPGEVTPAATEALASDSDGTGSDPAPSQPLTALAALDSTGPTPPPGDGVPPALKAVQPVTTAIAKVAGVALTVPGVIAALPASEDPVGDVIASVQNMLMSVNDAVAPLAQVPGDLYTLFVVAGMDAAATATPAVGSGLGLSGAAGTGLTPPTPPSALPFLPVSPFQGMPLLGDVTAPATLGGIAAAGLSTDLSLAGTAPLATEAAAPTSALSFLENTVRAVLAPASLTALAAFALPGIAGLLIICGAGMRVGYRQAKAALAVRTTSISRFARQGPLGVVRSGSLVSLHARRPRALRAVRPEAVRAVPLLEQVA